MDLLEKVLNHLKRWIYVEEVVCEQEIGTENLSVVF